MSICVICQSGLSPPVAQIDCGHRYHRSCVKRWCVEPLVNPLAIEPKVLSWIIQLGNVDRSRSYCPLQTEDSGQVREIYLGQEQWYSEITKAFFEGRTGEIPSQVLDAPCLFPRLDKPAFSNWLKRRASVPVEKVPEDLRVQWLLPINDDQSLLMFYTMVMQCETGSEEYLAWKRSLQDSKAVFEWHQSLTLPQDHEISHQQFVKWLKLYSWIFANLAHVDKQEDPSIQAWLHEFPGNPCPLCKDPIDITLLSKKPQPACPFSVTTVAFTIGLISATLWSLY